MLLANIFNAKINNQCELDEPPIMLSQPGHKLALAISVFVEVPREVPLEYLVGKESRLWEPIHSLVCFNVDGPICSGFLVEAVLVNDFL